MLAQPAHRNFQEPGPPPALLALTIVTVLALLAAAYMAFAYAPTEATLGPVQRVLYFHLASAYAGALAFLITAVCGGVYLFTSRAIWDLAAHSSAEVGLVLLTMTLLSGPVWADYVWGKAWTWDPKLTSTLTMWLAYAAYLMLRRGIGDSQRRARFSAVYGMLAFTGVIMTFFGISFTQTGIQPVVMSDGSALFSLGSRIGQAMMASLGAFVLMFAMFFWYRLRLATLASRVEATRVHVLYRSETPHA